MPVFPDHRGDPEAQSLVPAVLAIAALIVGLVCPWWTWPAEQPSAWRRHSDISVGLRSLEVCTRDDGCEARSWADLQHDKDRLHPTPIRSIAVELGVGGLDFGRWLRVTTAIVGLSLAALALLVITVVLEVRRRRRRGPWAPHRLALIVQLMLLAGIMVAEILAPATMARALDHGVGFYGGFVGALLGVTATFFMWLRERQLPPTELPAARVVAVP